ncbi:cob(I)yrinic acid a,c-diamide adenosyltransferase [Planctomycetota bacterium]
MKKTARILVITGDGKGKTTAAMGMALRASGHGMHAAVIQFVKQAETGEMQALKKIDNIDFIQTGLGFLPEKTSSDFEKHKAAAGKALSLAAEMIGSDKYDMIILDEVCFAVASGLLDDTEVLDTVSKAHTDQCIVLTGRGATDPITNIADTVSRISCLKHGLDSGISAQKGVEY